MNRSSQVYEKMRDIGNGGSHAEIVEVDTGHVYDLPELGVTERDAKAGLRRDQRLTFLKRSGGAIQYEEEWPGLQTQTVLRALISRTRYLNSVLPCAESERSIRFMQNALWEYEARAFRRKIQALNREQPAHIDDIAIPFSPMDCETSILGADGHVAWLESATLYIANFGWSDYEPWPEFWLTAEGPAVPRDQLTPNQLAVTRLYELGIPEVGDGIV